MAEKAARLSPAAMLRKSNKPLMEKRRRARINECLQQLKSVVLESMKKETSGYSKLEKADILELTVRHLRALQRQQMTAAVSNDPTVIGKYRAGFNECAKEVTRYLSTIEGINENIRSRLLNHLASCLQSVNSSQTTPTSTLQTEATGVTGAIQVIPATLPSGELAYFVPGQSSQVLLNSPVVALMPGTPVNMQSLPPSPNCATEAPNMDYYINKTQCTQQMNMGKNTGIGSHNIISLEHPVRCRTNSVTQNTPLMFSERSMLYSLSPNLSKRDVWRPW